MRGFFNRKPVPLNCTVDEVDRHLPSHWQEAFQHKRDYQVVRQQIVHCLKIG